MPMVNMAAPPPSVLYTSGHEVFGFGRLHVGLPSMATSGAPMAMPTTPTTSDVIASGRHGNTFCCSRCGATGVGSAIAGGGISTLGAGGGVSTFGGGGVSTV